MIRSLGKLRAAYQAGLEVAFRVEHLSAGGGKSFALLMDPLRHINTPDFYCIMFRRQAVEIGKPGGLADASKKIYPLLGGEYFTATKTWKFPSGAKIVFMGLDHIDDVEALRGVEISRLYFDFK